MNNIFNIEVGSYIPDDMTPGNIYVNALQYANKMPADIPERFLIASKPRTYLGRGPIKEVVACVSNDNRVSSDKIYITPKHPGFKVPEPTDTTRVYLDSTNNILYKPVENPRENGYRPLKYIKEQEVVYQESTTDPYVYAYGDDIATEEVEQMVLMYDTISVGVSSDSLPLNVVVVRSLEELHSLTPCFMGVYKVVNEDGTFSAYLYNPYDAIQQDYFKFNCDVFY